MHGLSDFEMMFIDAALSPMTYVLLGGLVVGVAAYFLKKPKKKD